ncbi:MAG: amidohydrolase family protein [Pseudomonadota bacterium]
MTDKQTLFDTHFHIIDKKFPLVRNNGFIPETFTVNDYCERLSGFNLIGGVVVSGSFQANNQDFMLEALNILGTNFKGILNLAHPLRDEEIIQLNKLGIAGVRFNLYREGSESIKYLDIIAQQIFNLAGWHIELYLDSKDLPELSSLIERLPAVSIDHLGLRKSGFKHLLKLVDKGVKVKASGFGRVDFDPAKAINEINAVNPSALMFGTDLPSTRAPTPFQNSDITIISDTLDSSATKRVFFENAIEFYNIKIR